MVTPNRFGPGFRQSLEGCDNRGGGDTSLFDHIFEEATGNCITIECESRRFDERVPTIGKSRYYDDDGDGITDRVETLTVDAHGNATHSEDRREGTPLSTLMKEDLPTGTVTTDEDYRLPTQDELDEIADADRLAAIARYLHRLDLENNILGTMAGSLALDGVAAAAAYGVIGYKGGEFIFRGRSRNQPYFRIDPFGWGRYGKTHYHRYPGPDKHRPWEGGW